ncbi:E3 ubiquitin-protein ligase PRT1 [Linum perenne]
MENVAAQSFNQNVEYNNEIFAPNSTTQEEEEESFLQDFQCCICLDLLYKPVVLACGHLSCFWCVFKAMDTSCESYCPICRHPYNHFPSVCQLLHFLLTKMYPMAYRKREMQVREEEKKVGHFSPQFDSQPLRTNEIYLHSTIHLMGKISSTKDTSTIMESQEENLDGNGKTEEMHLTSIKSSEDTMHGLIENDRWNEKELELGTSKRPSISDLLCVECNELLFRPVTLNCGHVYCEVCMIVPDDGYPRCQICQIFHPNRFLSVCLVLEHVIEGCFSRAYTERREKLLKQGSFQGRLSSQHFTRRSSPVLPTFSTASRFLGKESNIHFGYGCDSCGITPIIGARYRCKDCVEKIGYDLCEACYKSPAKIFGRFNQQHRPDHTFELMEPQTIDELLKLNFGYSGDEIVDAPEHHQEQISPDIGSSDDHLHHDRGNGSL